MQAALHGAKFTKAAQLRSSMTLKQLHDFSVGSERGKPEHVKKRHPHKNLGAYLHPKKR